MLTIDVEGERLEVALADTSEERARGLMEVEDLGELDGMLFVFERPRIVAFTMRNTLIPLDIWFIDTGGSIAGTAEMTPCTGEPCVTYGSPTEVERVLETPLGVYEFLIGDRVSTVVSG